MNPNPVWEKDRTYSKSGPISSGKVSSIEVVFGIQKGTSSSAERAADQHAGITSGVSAPSSASKHLLSLAESDTTPYLYVST
jgi:hypothetical protein